MEEYGTGNSEEDGSTVVEEEITSAEEVLVLEQTQEYTTAEAPDI